MQNFISNFNSVHASRTFSSLWKTLRRTLQSTRRIFQAAVCRVGIVSTAFPYRRRLAGRIPKYHQVAIKFNASRLFLLRGEGMQLDVECASRRRVNQPRVFIPPWATVPVTNCWPRSRGELANHRVEGTLFLHRFFKPTCSCSDSFLTPSRGSTFNVHY